MDAKKCTKCGETKSLEEFPKHCRTRDGRESRCRVFKRVSNARWKAKNPEKVREADRKRGTGFSATLFDAAMKQQDNACAICGKTLTSGRAADSAAADHCHETGACRGVLCAQCNRGLGHFGDDIGRLEKVISYLTSPPVHPTMAAVCNGVSKEEAREIVTETGVIRIP